MNFDVNKFETEINRIVEISEVAVNYLDALPADIEYVQQCIGNQESPELYQAWEKLKEEIRKIKNKYVTRKEEFITELMNYKELTLKNNNVVYQSINTAISELESISSQIDAL